MRHELQRKQRNEEQSESDRGILDAKKLQREGQIEEKKACEEGKRSDGEAHPGLQRESRK